MNNFIESGQCTVVVVSKSPWSLASKTRLAASIGRPAATRVAVALLETTISRATSSGADVLCSFAGTRREAERVGTQAHFICHHNQVSDSSLGALTRAMQDASSIARGNVIFIPSDSPLVTPELTKNICSSLKHQDVVLIPSTDGGIAAIGFSRTTNVDLRGVESSSGRVAQEVVALLRARGITVLVGAPLVDIDVLEDIRAARNLAEFPIGSSLDSAINQILG